MPIQRSAGSGVLDGLVLVVFLAVLTLTGCGDDSRPLDHVGPEPEDQEVLERMAA